MRAFVDYGPGGPNPGARGNACRVELCTGPLPADPPDESITTCRSWLVGEGAAEARCWGAGGRLIQLCGHGLLCTGVAWQLRGRPVATLTMNAQQIDFSRTEQIAWIGVAGIDCSLCAVPTGLADYFPVPPTQSAFAGGSTGYLILEWPPGTDLRTLPTPGSDLSAVTERALIATCVDGSHPDIDIQMRYFAPQYSHREDSATGSAMRVLASYWRERLGPELTAWQCSAAGGLLLSRQAENRYWIGGRIRLESTA